MTDALAESVNSLVDCRYPGSGRIIQRDDVDLMAALGESARKIEDSRSHAAGVRVKRWQNLQNFQCQIT